VQGKGVWGLMAMAFPGHARVRGSSSFYEIFLCGSVSICLFDVAITGAYLGNSERSRYFYHILVTSRPFQLILDGEEPVLGVLNKSFEIVPFS
jgi:hypothetical protein